MNHRLVRKIKWITILTIAVTVPVLMQIPILITPVVARTNNVAGENEFLPGGQSSVPALQQTTNLQTITDGASYIELGTVMETTSSWNYDHSQIFTVVSSKIVNGQTLTTPELLAQSLETYPYVYDGWRWPESNPVVNYYVNENTNDTVGEAAAIQRAAATWNAAGAYFSFNYAGTTSSTVASQNGINEIMWIDKGDIGWGAQTTCWWTGGIITECDIVFNDYLNWSTASSPSADRQDVESVALHELGHWLALDHVNDPTDVMHPGIASGTTLRNLNYNDILGIRAIYGSPISIPIVSESTGASDILNTSARLNGEVTSTGGENPIVHIYWGNADGGTIPGSWANDINLGTRAIGSFDSSIFGLTPNSVYYYRSYAINSSGATWASSTRSFTAKDPPVNKIVFTSAPQSTTAGLVSAQVTIQVQDIFGNPINQGSGAIINLISTSISGKFDTSPTGSFNGTVTTVNIPVGGSSANFYYKDNTSGNPILSGVSSGIGNGFQQETVLPGAFDHITLNPANVILSVRNKQTFMAEQRDQYNNLLSGSIFTWVITNAQAGSINSAGVFTSGTIPGVYPNVVQATFGGKTGTASLTILAGPPPSVDYATGTSPSSVAAGDFNGDYHPDLAIVSSSENKVNILLNNGDGTFASKIDYPTGQGPLSVALGDFNEDSYIDLVVANGGDNTLSVLLNKGDGTFASKIDYRTGADPCSVAVGDFNGDSYPDLVVANNIGVTVSVLLNLGNGMFAPKIDYTTGSNPYSVTVADVNGDSHPDLIAVNNTSHSVSVLINKGDGIFAFKVDYTTGLYPRAVACVDLNNDSYPDIAVSNTYSNTVSVLLNNGNGTFAPKVDYSSGIGPGSITAADFNGDSYPDLIVVNTGNGSNSVSVLTNSGNAAFTSKVDYPTGGGPISTVACDFNSNTHVDLAVANQTDGTVRIILNPNTSTLTPEIRVEGNSIEIKSGGSTPRIADWTDFGNTGLSGGIVDRTFTIKNIGDASLTLSGTPKVSLSGANATDFSVTLQPASPVAVAGQTTFTIRFDPSAIGVRTASVSIANNDADENPYTFAIQGSGAVAFTVTYYGNGSTSGTAPVDANSPYNSGATVTVLGNAGGLAKTGNTFAGWNTAANGSGTSYASGATFTMGAANVILYAKWTVNNYTVTFNNNGGAGVAPLTEPVAFGALVTTPTTLPTFAGHNLSGWNTAANGSGTAWNFASSTMGAANMTLYAQWSTGSYTVTYNGNGSTSGTAPVDAGSPYNSGATVTVLGNAGSLAKTGNTFAGWNTAANGSGTSYASGATFTMGSTNVILYAKWTVNNYTVTFNNNGGAGVAPLTESVVFGALVTAPTTLPTYASHTLSGWNTAANGSGTAWNFASSTMGAADMTLYAQWSTGSYTVTYNGNGSTSGTAPTDAGSPYNSGATVTVLGNTGNLAKTGNIFAGWNTAANGSGTSYASGATFTMGSANVILYAKWTVNNYTVTFNNNGGAGVAPLTEPVAFGALVTAPTTLPTFASHTLSGWNTAANGSGTAWNFASSTMGAANMTLYAQWSTTNYTVTYNGNGSTSGTAPTDAGSPYNSGATVTVLGNAGSLAKTGNTFAGWNTAANGSGTSYASGATFTMGSTNVILYAKWTVNNYTVTFNNNGGAGVAPLTESVVFGALVTAPTTLPTFAGHTLSGWNTAANGSGTAWNFASSTMGAANMTLYAQWTEIPSGGGGGGGGGGFGSQLIGINLAGTSPFMDGNGKSITAGQISTPDGNVTLTVPVGVYIWNAAGAAQSYLSATLLADPPQAPPKNSLVAAYEMGPSGVTFNPAITLTLNYTNAHLPLGTAEADLYIAWWDGTAWVKLTSTIDMTAKTVTATIVHFTTFALFAQAAPPTTPPPTTSSPPPPTTTPPLTTTALPTTTVSLPTSGVATTTPPAASNNNSGSNSLLPFGLVLIGAIALGTVLVLKRRGSN